MKVKFLIIFFLLWAALGFAQQPVETIVFVIPDSSKALIGEQRELTFSATFDASKKVIWPQLGDTLPSGIEILEKSEEKSSFDTTIITQKNITQKVLITSFDSGYKAIPPFEFIIGTDTFRSEAFLIHYQTVPVDTAKGVYDIREPFMVKYTFYDWLKDNKELVIGGFLGLLLVLAALWYYFKVYRKRPVVELVKEEPKKPAHEIALEKLNALKEKKLWQNDNTKEYHALLSEIIREYLELRFGIYALERTTPEIMASVKPLPLTNTQKEHLNMLLNLSDLVKFAKEKPLPDENERVLNIGFEFVESTKEMNPNA